MWNTWRCKEHFWWISRVTGNVADVVGVAADILCWEWVRIFGSESFDHPLWFLKNGSLHLFPVFNLHLLKTSTDVAVNYSEVYKHKHCAVFLRPQCNQLRNSIWEQRWNATILLLNVLSLTKPWISKEIKNEDFNLLTRSYHNSTYQIFVGNMSGWGREWQKQH